MYLAVQKIQIKRGEVLLLLEKFNLKFISGVCMCLLYNILPLTSRKPCSAWASLAVALLSVSTFLWKYWSCATEAQVTWHSKHSTIFNIYFRKIRTRRSSFTSSEKTYSWSDTGSSYGPSKQMVWRKEYVVRYFFIFALRNVLLIFKQTGYGVALTNLDVDSVQIAGH